jgi:hypothetical protein
VSLDPSSPRVPSSPLRRLDGVIAVGLVILLVALLVVGLSHHPGPGRLSSVPVRSSASRSDHPAVASPAPALLTTTTDPPAASSSTTTTAALPSTTTSTALSATGSPLPPPAPGPVTAVGDSIMLDIQPYLEQDVPGVQVDGMVSRQFETGIGVVAADRAAGTLGNVLVVELGTNGSVTAQDIDAMMQAAAGVARVVFVNVDVPRPWEATDNAVLAAGVARYPGVAYLADWYTLSSAHPEWFAADQVHLDPAGSQAMAQLIAEYT